MEITDNTASGSTASLECSGQGLVIVVFNAFGMRVRTITLGFDGSFRDELSYVADSAEPAETFVPRLLESLHAKNRKN